ncbi:hypothetical protein EK21DRAFT_67137 [Setomelanomma holmii]|uniref:CENP-V/GFA domain-containing protein n=1 Tax=Setomelanomma holmii TaxID=210430 RepID=A0A9P4HA77_9PLEO|nr:hypothetical protein EK21DRAFT_67137 [Setomelanomma holmii]
MTTADQDPVTLTAHCLCKANIFTSRVSKSNLPLQAYACHCDSCRHVTGALYSVDLRWPTPRAEVNVSKLKVFHHFASIDLLFCPTCSTPMFFADRNDKDRLLGVFSGVLTNEDVNLVEFANHIFINDTKEGGASVWLRHNASGSQIKRFKKTIAAPVPICCKCKGVEFVLHRGDYTGIEEDELPFHIDPVTHKLLAGFCGCDSCRLQAGVDLFNWTYSEMKYLSFGNSDRPFPTNSYDLKRLADARDPALGTLTYYSSREGVERYFCSNCSACVFYATTLRPEIIDVAIGLLETPVGARAENLLSWSWGARISHREDADGGWRGKLFDSIEKQAEEYRIQRVYPKNHKRLVKDENGGKTPESWYFGEKGI